MQFVYLFATCFLIAFGLTARPLMTLLVIAVYAGAFLAASATFFITLPSPVDLIAYGVVGWPVVLLAVGLGTGLGVVLRRSGTRRSDA
ncbi:hypothetical protein [Vannielia sp.]|uniref:hypothetical protein n=1 Tax=Vannielia sp. TaxID=2813045 RepID=UPI00260999D9|nr:hypothetical protein [Vannielia sp.]MDF1874099.1 hypothetical protein [Vannielia sp.]